MTSHTVARVAARTALRSAICGRLVPVRLYDPAQKTRDYPSFCFVVSHSSHRMPGTRSQYRPHSNSNSNTNSIAHSYRLTPEREPHYFHDAGEPVFRLLLRKD